MSDLTSSDSTGDPVLVGVDGSESGYEAVGWAAEEASWLGAPLRILHAWLWPLYHVQLGPPPGGPPGAGLRAQAEHVLSRAQDVARASSPRTLVETSLVTGAAAPELLRYATGSRMLVVGNRGLGGFTGLLLGSVGVTVTAHAHCPVVVVRGDPVPGGAVAVGFDGSAQSLSALVTGFGEAHRRRVPLLAVHAWTMPVRAEGAKENYERVRRRAECEGRELAERAVVQAGADFPDVTVDVKIGSRSPGAELVDASSRAQLVVVGSRGVGGLRGLLLGSTAHAVIQHGACPVLVVRAERTAAL